MVHLDAPDEFPEESVLLKLNSRAGLLLAPTDIPKSEQTFRRIGICTRPDQFLGSGDDWLCDGLWTELIDEII